MKNMIEEDFVRLGNSDINISASTIGLVTLLKKIIRTNIGTITHANAEGVSSKELIFFTNEISKYEGRLIYKYGISGYQIFVWIWENSVVELVFSDDNFFKIECVSLDAEFATNIVKLLSDNISPKVKKGHVFSIIKQGHGLSLSNVGNAGISLSENNYSRSVVTAYKEAVDDLNSESPSGRIVILEGEPGTGKTHLIKSFLMDVPEAMFVLIPPDMVSELAGPELLPVLMVNKLTYANDGPIILVLEDADQCLVKRDGNNINSIQSLLNLSDGILGSLLDLRVIATTNANKLEIEDAILRPGRLSQRIEVGSLNPKEATDLYKKLCPDDSNQKIIEHVTLATVYSLARKAGWKPNIKKPVK